MLCAKCQLVPHGQVPCTILCFLLAQVRDFRKLVDGKIGDKHEEVMSRMGAIMAAGILDAGHQHCFACLCCKSYRDRNDLCASMF